MMNAWCNIIRGLLLLAVLPVAVQAQIVSLEEGKAATINGISYGYLISNEQVKSAGGEEYSRFEVTLYATNQSGCTRLYTDGAERPLSAPAANIFATFQCTNANGKRLTAKQGMVKLRDFYIPVRMSSGSRQTLKAGYVFSDGETIKTTIIVLVPNDERPQFNCTLNNPVELR